MNESSKDAVILVSILAVGGLLITGICDYLYDALVVSKKKQAAPARKQPDEDPLANYPQPPQMINRRTTVYNQKIGKWGALKVKKLDNDPVLLELQKMASLVNEVERVNNLIIDLELDTVQMFENPIVAHKPKLTKDDPFLDPKALVEPLSFVLHTPELRTAQMLSFTKKWLRSGPRANIFFQPSEVKAAIVSMGGMVPGVNTVIKQLVYTLEQIYGVDTIIGIKHSFETDKRQTIPLTCKDVMTLHHYGGSYLGVGRSDLSPEWIADMLANEEINQLYIIGGPGTLKLANELHETFKSRKLKIAFCVIPKQITNAIPITERSIGFQTALQESQRMVAAGYTESHAHENGVAIIKVAGKQSGFLAVETSLASRNIQACLVPQFPFELYGEKGLLTFIHQILSTRSNCTIVVAEGCNQSILDYDPPVVSYDWDGTPIKEDINKIIKSELKKYLGERKVKTAVKTVDTYETRASPANSKDTSICCKFAAESIHCVMCGYTNFMIGSITNKTVMIPMQEVISGNYSDRLVESSDYWTRLLLMTCQPSFRNS